MTNIDWVKRDIAENAICFKMVSKDKITFFYRSYEEIRRVGACVSDKEFTQARAILKHGGNSMDWRMRKDRKIDKPEFMEAIEGRNLTNKGRNLTKIDFARLGTIMKNGICYLPKGWLRINYRIRQNGISTYSPRHPADIDAAIRMQQYALDGYKKGSESRRAEFAELIEFREIIEKANRLLNEWKQASKTDKKIIIETLVYVVSCLEKCRNDFKIAARDQIEEVLPLTDSIGRENPGALAARTVAALNRLGGRFSEMRIIQPIVALRREVLFFEKNWFETQVRQIGIMLRSILNRPYEKLLQNSVDIDRRLGQSLYLAGILWVSPYFERAQLSKTFLLAAKKAIRSKQPEEIVKNTIFAHHVINGGSPPKL